MEVKTITTNPSAPGVQLHIEPPSSPFANWASKLQASALAEEDASYKQIFSLLVNNKENQFFSEIWEKNPAVFRRGSSATSATDKAGLEFLSSLFSSEMAIAVTNASTRMDEEEAIVLPGRDFNEVKYDAQQKRVAREQNKKYKDGYLKKSFDEGYTVQFFQPQRHVDSLASINLGLEYEFGNLAGASAYLTPPKSQGLAPHFDDVEVFILQTEGSKIWRLWKSEMDLPETYSKDIARAQLPGKCVEFTLYAGDMLYMPRGTIHEAESNTSFSTHVTFSVYQRYNVKSLLVALLPELIETHFLKSHDLRRGLPLRMNEKLGTFASLSSDLQKPSKATSTSSIIDPLSVQSVAAENLPTWRKSFMDSLRTSIVRLADSLEPAMVDKAADEIFMDFMKFRLPMAEPPSASNISPELIRIIDPHSFACLVTDMDGIPVLGLQHSVMNESSNHMGHENPEIEAEFHLMLPVRMYPIVIELQNNYKSGISFDDLVNKMEIHRIDNEEIAETLQQLALSGFLVEAHQDEKRKKENRGHETSEPKKKKGKIQKLRK